MHYLERNSTRIKRDHRPVVVHKRNSRKIRQIRISCSLFNLLCDFLYRILILRDLVITIQLTNIEIHREFFMFLLRQTE